jgi:type II secretory pathway component PulM
MKIAVKEIAIRGVEFWVRRSSRERAFLTIGAVLSVILLGYHFLFSPFVDRLRIVDRLITQKESEIVEMSQLRKQVLAAQQKISGVENRIVQYKGFSLFSTVEGIAVKNHIKDKIVFIRPQPSQVLGDYREVAVEVKVESVTLAQTVKFLETIQASPQFLRVKRAQLKTRYNDPRLLDGTFVVASYEQVTK